MRNVRKIRTKERYDVFNSLLKILYDGCAVFYALEPSDSILYDTSEMNNILRQRLDDWLTLYEQIMSRSEIWDEALNKKHHNKMWMDVVQWKTFTRVEKTSFVKKPFNSSSILRTILCLIRADTKTLDIEGVHPNPVAACAICALSTPTFTQTGLNLVHDGKYLEVDHQDKKKK
eukprot:241867_1